MLLQPNIQLSLNYYKLHPNHQYIEIFEIINFKGYTLESTNWISRNITFTFHSLLTSIISQLLGFITFDVFEVQEEYFVLFASLLFAEHANHLPKTLAPSANYYNVFTIDIPIALLDLRCKVPQFQYIFYDSTSNSKRSSIIQLNSTWIK
jgi:hypothetical protein